MNRVNQEIEYGIYLSIGKPNLLASLSENRNYLAEMENEIKEIEAQLNSQRMAAYPIF